MSLLTNEHEADQSVIKTLMSQIAKLQGENMQDIVLYKDQDGNIKRAHNFENLDRDQITREIDVLTADLQRWQTALKQYDNLNGSDQAAPAPTEPTPTEVPTTEPVAAPVALTQAPAPVLPVDTQVLPQAPVITDVQPPVLQ